ncbi:DUF7159 family protein [Mycobacterium sp. NPDC003323]
MSLVLGLSVTSKDVHGELVDGVTGQGDHLDRRVLDVDEIEDYLAQLPADADLHAVGLTWSHDAEDEAIKVREALDTYSGGAPVVPVRDVEAAEALARGIADLTGHDFLVVCVVEPDSSVVATVDGFHIHVESVDHADAATLTDRVLAVVRAAKPSPDAVYILGSADTDDLVTALRADADRPVITATEADFALTRGAALASAHAASIPDEPEPTPGFSKVKALTVTLVAAVIVFVVSVSLTLAWPSRPAPEPEPDPRPQLAQNLAPAPAAPKAPERAKLLNVPPPVQAPPPPPAPGPAPAPRIRDNPVLDRVPFIDRIR